MFAIEIKYGLRDVLRIVIVICCYLLLRPYLQRYLRHKQAMHYEADDKADCGDKDEDAVLSWVLKYQAESVE
ncbi:uncharacterized protein T551_00777 [Pneumocystis jirovecii RU7]|uniref:Uncharacterized protein n=1 Tax=Pneumocystis jirovecii (strain RU7) TaxID=1408657 RepID=A0A0W4ZUN1_PNEJ7|nr:uncharacterized protein T551_00777 [Pneumocystis jirovecii RU7]KTW32095.1 hypothetical protein T551_00777 [Pneumocystis jirovecii RU7]